MHLPNCSRKLPTEKICSYYRTSQPTPSVAWLSISRSPPDALYSGITVNVGGLGAAEKASEINCENQMWILSDRVGM